MDGNGGLNYEQRNELNHTLMDARKKSPSTEKRATDKWIEYKDDVINVVKKGIISNKPKPRKIIPTPPPEPEINRILHIEVRSVGELLSYFSPEEKEVFNQELISFSAQPEPTRYLIDQIDYLNGKPKNDLIALHLCQLYKFLLKKRADMAFS